MLNMSILDKNLNDQVSYDQFFKAFGYTDKDTIYLRAFDDTKTTKEARNLEVECGRFENIISTLEGLNTRRWGIFYVVNGGGQSKEHVKVARAQYIDFDDYPFDEQIRRINDFPLEPSIIIKTKKSLHCYWLLVHGEIEHFTPIQKRLISYFGSDPVIKDKSRVMRLYGFNHQKTEIPVMVTLLKFDPDLKYTQAQFDELLPTLKKAVGTKKPKVTTNGTLVPQGERYHYVMSRISEMLNRLGDSADDEMILSLIDTDYRCHCEPPHDDPEDFREKYLKAIKDIRAKHDEEEKDPGLFKKGVKVWNYENPGKPFDPDVVGWDTIREMAGRYNPSIHDKQYKKAETVDEGFYRINKQGEISGVIDSAVVEYMKRTVKMFIFNGVLYIYENGVFIMDEKGNRFKTMLSQLIYHQFVTANKLDNLYKLLMIDNALNVYETDINNHPPYMINVRNGMLNLKTLELTNHDPKYLSINQIPHDYIADFNYKGTTTKEFLTELLSDPQDLTMFIEYAGYCMTKDMGKQKFLIIKGPGGTGKSELIHLVERTVGRENVSSLTIQDTNERFSPAFLVGKLLNVNADISSEVMNNISGLKKLIGEDTMRGEYKAGKIFSFKPYAKLLFSANRIPESKDDKTNAYYRRMLILTVNKRCKEIPKLSERLRSETKRGVFFHIAVDAARRMYQEERPITESKNSKAAVQQLYEAGDSVVAFLKHKTRKDPQSREQRDTVYDYYREYCYNNSRTPKTKNGFYENMRDKGIEEGKINGAWYFKGFKIIQHAKEALTYSKLLESPSEEENGEN